MPHIRASSLGLRERQQQVIPGLLTPQETKHSDSHPRYTLRKGGAVSKPRLLLATCPLVTSPVDCILHLPVMLSLSAGSPEDVPGAAADQDGDSSNQLFSERVTCSCPRGIQSAGGIRSETAKEKEECPLSSGKDGHEGRMAGAGTFQEELTGPWMPGLQISFLVLGMNSK